MRRYASVKVLLPALLLAGLVLVAGRPAGGQTEKIQKEVEQKLDKAAMAMPDAVLEEGLKKARVNGKYRMLLRQFRVTKDAPMYKDVYDGGFRDLREYAGFNDLPRGHWVYAAPYWYIWRELSATPVVKRAWGPEQATGPPDTPEAGDIATAWASRDQDNQDEWLLCEYAEPVVPTAVLIYETFNPGAVTRVSAFKLDGTEVEVWKGKDPTEPGSDKGVSVIPVKVNFKTNRVKVYLASTQVPGWNEIDAVGLRDKAEKTQWAIAVEASSTYAQQAPVPPPPVSDPMLGQRVMQLENEVRQLKAQLKEMERLKAMVEELQKEKDKKK